MTERWLIPNLFASTDVAPVGTITTRYNATASAASWDGDAGTAWADFLDEWDPHAVEFYIGTVREDTDGLVSRAIPMLASRGIKCSVTTAGPRGYFPGVTPAPTVTDGTNGSASATWDIANVIAAFEALGGTVDYIFMDSATRRTISNGSNKSAHAAFRALGTVAANTGIRYTAFLAGSAGNNFRVRYVVSGTNTPLSITATTDATALVRDTFTRSASGSWGTPDTGSAWTVVSAASATYGVSGTQGTMALGSAPGQAIAHTPAASNDQLVTVAFSLSAVPAVVTHTVGLWLRYADANNHYRANVNIQAGGLITASILKTVSGTTTALAGEASAISTDGSGTSLTLTPGTRYWASAQVVGTSVSIRVWQDGQDRPSSSLRSATDDDLASGGNVALSFACLTGATGLPITASFDDLLVSTAPTTGDVTVNVSTDGAGAAISTADEVRDAVDADSTAQLIVTPAHQSGSTGLGVVSASDWVSLLYGDDGYNFTQEQTAAEIVSYMQTILAARPDVRFVWHDAMVLAPYDGVAGYSGADYPGGQQPDAKDTIDIVLGAMDDAGILDRLHAIHDDWGWEFAEALVPSTNAAAESDWYTRMHVIDAQIRSWGVGVQRSFVSAYGGTPGYPGASDDGYTASDQTYQELCLAFVKEYLAKKPANAPMLDGLRVQSFNYHPRVLAPEGTAYSFLDTARRIWGAYGLVTGSGSAPRTTAVAPVARSVSASPRPVASSR